MGSPPPAFQMLKVGALCLVGMALATRPPVSAQTGGVKADLREYEGPAQITVRALGRHKLELSIDPRDEQAPLTVRVELPSTGPERWPAEDVEVLGSEGQPIPVCRDGLEWHRLSITVPPKQTTYLVQVPDSRSARPSPALPDESERMVTDPQTGLAAAICPWFDGRRAALSLRFDDSHPTHLSTVLPILREYGFKGTFMINPGREDYTENQAGWKACVERGDMEFANHTLHHRGAATDEEAEREIGDAAQYIWSLFPGKSRLLALNLGGGTKWTVAKPLRYYLDKYSSFYVAGSLGMDDVYGNRVAALREHLARHIERGLWCRIHFHSVGDGLASTEESFRAAMDVVKERESELWIAGMADIHKYQEERKAAKLSLETLGVDRLRLRVSVATDPALYDQLLTLQLALPPGRSAADLAIREEKGALLPIRTPVAADPGLVGVNVPPLDAAYTVGWRLKTEGTG